MTRDLDPEGPTRRLFFALWPDQEVRDRLSGLVACLRRRVRARWIAAEHLHMTLVFLGSVPEALVPNLADRELEPAEAFELRLQDLQFRRRRRMLWIVPAAVPPALERLVAQLMRAMEPGPLRPDPRPFHAHMTLARKLSGDVAEPPRFRPILWRVRALALVESEPDRLGAHYRVLRTWPLRSQAMPEGTSME